MKHLFFFVGRPGSGKETQSRLLAEKLGYEMFSTGIKFREIMASGSQLGEKVKESYEKGLLLPAWVADFMFENFVFNLPSEKGSVFEGSGRDVHQAEVIEKVCTWLGRSYTVFNLEVSEDEVVRRTLARKRDAMDADESIIRNRLSEYAKSTAPAIDYFRSVGKCIDINGEGTPEKIHEDVVAAASKFV